MSATDYTGVCDETLIEETAGGDMAAFAEIYRRHLHKVIGFIVLRAPRDVSPEDMAADAFAAALAAIGEYRPGDGLTVGSWLCGFAGRELTRARHEWWREQRALAGQTTALVQALNDEADAAPAGAALPEGLRAQLEELSPDHRTVIELRVLEGQTAETVGELLGFTAREVTRRRYNAVERLRRMHGLTCTTTAGRRRGSATVRAAGAANRARVAEYTATHPDVPLEQICTSLGLSRSTVITHRRLLKELSR
jgi:RNA polymerase sigma-70 factor (ECF subfamily)